MINILGCVTCTGAPTMPSRAQNSNLLTNSKTLHFASSSSLLTSSAKHHTKLGPELLWWTIFKSIDKLVRERRIFTLFTCDWIKGEMLDQKTNYIFVFIYTNISELWTFHFRVKKSSNLCLNILWKSRGWKIGNVCKEKDNSSHKRTESNPLRNFEQVKEKIYSPRSSLYFAIWL